MTQLNMTTLRQALSEIFFPSTDTQRTYKYITPIQGNWWNPTDTESDPLGTWIGYSIPEIVPIIRGSHIPSINGQMNTCRAMIHLQFIGTEAESFARSVLHWDVRQDVMGILARFDGQLMYDSRRIVQSMYYQDGANSTQAYNIFVKMLFSDIVVPTNQEKLLGAELNGTLYIQE